MEGLRRTRRPPRGRGRSADSSNRVEHAAGQHAAEEGVDLSEGDLAARPILSEDEARDQKERATARNVARNLRRTVHDTQYFREN